MRVLLTTDTVGGVWTFTQELAVHLLGDGHAVALVSFGRTPSESQCTWAAEQRTRFGGSFHFTPSTLPLEWMQNNGSVFADGADLLLRLAHDFRADILHSNQFCWGALPLDIPKLITAHSDVMSWADAVKPSALEPSTWLSRYRSLVQQGLDQADAVIAPTSWMRSALRANFSVRVPFAVIYNGRSAPKPDAAVERTLRAITVGRLWDEAKGLATILDLNSPMPIVLAGEERFEDSVATRASCNLRALGVLDQQEVIDTMLGSSVYIAASIYEPFGLAPLEAAMCGCAIIARDLPSFREVWGDAAVYFQTAEQLERALTEFAYDPYKLRASQRAARERAARYTAEAMTAAYVERYAGLVASREREHTQHAA